MGWEPPPPAGPPLLWNSSVATNRFGFSLEPPTYWFGFRQETPTRLGHQRFGKPNVPAKADWEIAIEKLAKYSESNHHVMKDTY